MIKVDRKNVYLMANYSRNMVSTYRIQELVSDDMEISVTCKPDWKKIIESGHIYTGVICFNGAHFGILCKVYAGQAVISAEVWTEHEGENMVNEAFVYVNRDLDDDWRNIKLVYKKDKTISIETTEGKMEKELLGKTLDYTNAYMWIGCCDNHKPTPFEYQGNWTGQIKKLLIKGKDKYFGKYEFKKKTRYKIYDSSGNGNHLISKYLNDEGHIIIY